MYHVSTGALNASRLYMSLDCNTTVQGPSMSHVTTGVFNLQRQYMGLEFTTKVEGS